MGSSTKIKSELSISSVEGRNSCNADLQQCNVCRMMEKLSEQSHWEKVGFLTSQPADERTFVLLRSILILEVGSITFWL